MQVFTVGPCLIRPQNTQTYLAQLSGGSIKGTISAGTFSVGSQQ